MNIILKSVLFFILTLFFAGCYNIHSQIQDGIHGWESYFSITDNCLENPSANKNCDSQFVRALASWYGRLDSELLAAWGPATQTTGLGVYGDPNSAKTYVWVHKTVTPGDNRLPHSEPNRGFTPHQERVYECHTTVIAAADGRITNISVDRLSVCETYFLTPHSSAIPLF
ncbi:MAG: hypothetical protein LBF22_04595 [Deltaproteobacteria bacterium]|jgi:hypothetical protein|nr:hypothetical protein [Deltaproteobacteria bacterium]